MQVPVGAHLNLSQVHLSDPIKRRKLVAADAGNWYRRPSVSIFLKLSYSSLCQMILPSISSSKAYLIFVTDTTDGVCGEKLGHVEKFSP